MIQPEEIVQRYEERRRIRGPFLANMQRTQMFYNNEIQIPLSELEKNEAPSVANLLIQGVDQLAMRLSSRLPDVDFPSAKPGQAASDKTAADARNAVLAWWDMNQLQKKLARRCRYLVAYGSAPALIRPVGTGYNSKRKMPYWTYLDPLCVFPSDSGDPDDIEPRNVIISRRQSLAWLRDRYPAQAGVLYKGRGATPDKMFELLEYMDEDETVLIVRGAVKGVREYADPAFGTAPQMLLERAPNSMGMCPVVIPGRITLDRITGQFDEIRSMFIAQARLSAYEMIAIRRGIFPELWAVTHPGSPGTARVITVADGRQGTIGEIENGTIMPITQQPGQQTSQAIDRLERAARVQGSIPADWGGESASNIRTAKRGEQVSSSASDPTLAELQTVLAESLQAENIRAIALSKALWGGRSTSFYMSRTGKGVSDDYVPNDAFANDFHYVKFSMPGVDAASIPIELGQRSGTGELSLYTERRLDPMVEDPDFEDRQVDVEALRKSLLGSLEQPGAVDPHEIALIISLLQEGKTMEDAVSDAHKQLQAEQAAMAAQTPAAGEPPGPETQPGLAPAPPPGAPAPGGGPPPLSQLMQQLRQPTQQSPAEKAMSPNPAMAGVGQ